ncbi:hypothetical protein WA026_019630 [Henosepilachna vigintioctopunctata]|uniref:Uncharacterized protein n=1 Tax=Henosepilachna vigintioctopunctata TaxID=420089 RepID=A0AAW1TR86_9CUCU
MNVMRVINRNRLVRSHAGWCHQMKVPGGCSFGRKRGPPGLMLTALSAHKPKVFEDHDRYMRNMQDERQSKSRLLKIAVFGRPSEVRKGRFFCERWGVQNLEDFEQIYIVRIKNIL